MSDAPAATTPWQHGRFEAVPGTREILFGRVWEDPAIELATFRPGGRLFCIASAGCTAIALAPHARSVVAVDINPTQLAYARERIAGAPARAGTAERLLGHARRFGALVGWSAARRRAFVELADPAAQHAMWRQLDTRRLRIAIDTLASRRLLSTVYHAALLEFLPPQFGAAIRARLERGIARFPNRDNPHARALFLGEVAAPRATPEATRIELVHADAAAYLEAAPAHSFDGFSISNILDGVDRAYRTRLLAAIHRAAAPGAYLVRRSFGEPATDTPGNPNLAADDRALLWGVVEAVPLGVTGGSGRA